MRELAARLATEAFAEGGFIGADGQPVVYQFESDSFTVELVDERWSVIHSKPSGATAWVRFSRFGTDPEVSVNFALE